MGFLSRRRSSIVKIAILLSTIWFTVAFLIYSEDNSTATDSRTLALKYNGELNEFDDNRIINDNENPNDNNYVKLTVRQKESVNNNFNNIENQKNESVVNNVILNNNDAFHVNNNNNVKQINYLTKRSENSSKLKNRNQNEHHPEPQKNGPSDENGECPLRPRPSDWNNWCCFFPRFLSGRGRFGAARAERFRRSGRNGTPGHFADERVGRRWESRQRGLDQECIQSICIRLDIDTSKSSRSPRSMVQRRRQILGRSAADRRHYMLS